MEQMKKYELELPENVGEVCIVFGTTGMRIMPEFTDNLNPYDQYELIMIIEDSLSKMKSEMIKALFAYLAEEEEANNAHADEDWDEEDLAAASKH